jgi:hypothetical protein
MAAVYAPDASLLAPGSEIIAGVEAIEGFWRAAIEERWAAGDQPDHLVGDGQG